MPELPKGWIKGSTGVAATNLTQPDSVGGVKTKEEIEEINRTLPRRIL